MVIKFDICQSHLKNIQNSNLFTNYVFHSCVSFPSKLGCNSESKNYETFISNVLKIIIPEQYTIFFIQQKIE